MHKKQEKYYLFDQEFNRKELIEFSEKKIIDNSVEDWEKEIFRFILQWFDENEFVEVKTSGSTGKPKTIVLRKKHMAASAAATLSFLQLKQGDKALLCLPADYIAGKMMIVRALVGGLKLHFIKPSLSPDLPKNTTFNFVAFVPSMLSDLIKLGRISELESFDNIILGGSEIPLAIENELAGLKNNIWHTYGMTETITHIALRKVNGQDRSEWFSPLEGVSIATKNEGKLEITSRNTGVRKLLTNDIAIISPEGNFKILGRSDNIINSGGLKIHPEELEKKISAVLENNFYVYGKSDEVLGQRIVLFVEGKPENDKVLQAEMGKYLKKSQIPKEIIWVEKFERTDSGKVVRKEYA